MLHIDLFYEISLYCKPYIFSVNNELSNIYDDNWFKTIMGNKFPNRKLFTATNYLDLYKKYLSEGDIYYVNDSLISKLQTRGIKAQYCKERPSNLFGYGSHILSFNGELYYQNNDTTILVDTEVIDISSLGYIKKNKAYFEIDETIKELFFKENLLRIMCISGLLCIISINGLYVEDHRGLNFYEIKDCINIVLLDKIYIINKNNEWFDIHGMKTCTPETKYMSSKNIKYLVAYEGNISLSDGVLSLHDNLGHIKKIDTKVKDIIVDDDRYFNWYYIK